MTHKKPVLEIRGLNEVHVGNEVHTMETIPVLRIFSVDGHLYQPTTTKVPYSAVPIGGRFRSGSQWCKRIDKDNNLQLDPNMPFADTCKIHVAVRDQQNVQMLEVMDRGPAAVRAGAVRSSS